MSRIVFLRDFIIQYMTYIFMGCIRDLQYEIKYFGRLNIEVVTYMNYILSQVDYDHDMLRKIKEK